MTSISATPQRKGRNGKRPLSGFRFLITSQRRNGKRRNFILIILTFNCIILTCTCQHNISTRHWPKIRLSVVEK